MKTTIINKLNKMIELANIQITYNEKLEEMDNDTLLFVFQTIRQQFNLYKDTQIHEIFNKYNIDLDKTTSNIGEMIKISNQLKDIMSDEDLKQLQTLVEL